MPKYKFIKLSNGKIVEGVFEAQESQKAKSTFTRFAFKKLATNEIAKKIAFVDKNGNKINLT